MTDDFILKGLTIHNFYLYKGDVKIDFSNRDPSKNLFLFVFENGGGKTSLYHAIKWGFYGNKLRYYKETKEMKPINMINTYARDNGEGFFVEIEFFINGDQYKLRRTCNNPHTGSDIVELATPTDTLIDIDAKELLDSIIPSDYGKFFMFDGRDLSSLSEAQDDRGQVDGILKLLGLSSVQSAKERLRDVKKQYDGMLAQCKKSNDQRSSAIEEYESLLTTLEEINEELEQNARETQEITQEITSLEYNINNAREVKKLTDERSQLKNDLASAEAYRDSALDQLIDSRKLIHMCLLEKEYSRIVEDNKQELDKLEQITGLDDNSLKGLELARHIINNSLTICPACHQNITGAGYEEIEQYIQNNERKLEAHRQNNQKIKEYAMNIKFFENLQNCNYKNAYKTLIRYGMFCNKIILLQKQIEEKELQIKQSGYDRVSIWMENRDAKKERLIKLQYEKKEIERRQTTINRRKDAAYCQMQKDAFGDAQIQPILNRIGFCEKMIGILEETITLGIIRMRDEILEISNKFFKDMTNKPDIYDHLEYIDDNSYLMTIIKKDGNSVPQGSTGELQIVTMSFLLALAKCSGKTTPIVMDTPTTNLDLIHSQGIERSLKAIPNQVLFLAQPAESTEHFIDGVKDIIAKKFITVHDANDNAIIEEEPL